VGRSIADISTNFRTLEFINLIKEVMSSGKKVSRETVMNDEQIFLMRIAPFLRSDNSIDGVVISFIDISEVKRLSGILEAVFNSSTSGINAKRAIRNEENQIVDFEYITANIEAEKIMGLSLDGLPGKRMLNAFPGMEKMHFQKYTEVVNTGKTASFEFHHPHNGRWYDVVCVKLMDGLVTTFTDVSENKEAAMLLQKGYEDLKVTSSQLEKSNFDLMQFASVASHDLKEPLRKIQAFGNLLKEKVRQKLDVTE
jgi:two-component system CheB/CheR fusion protein